MAELLSPSNPSKGRISEGPTASLVERTLEFVASEIAGWRDDEDREEEEGEERLNAQLCKYLTVAASSKFPMVYFFHEEKQTGTRRVDVSALPLTGMIIGETYHSKYNPFLVFEGKRLPTPGTGREKEYVTGGMQLSGGIQRFKLGLHGAKQEVAAMVGYVQRGTFDDWLSTVNGWIGKEALGGSESEEMWTASEILTVNTTDAVLRTIVMSSSHSRVRASSPRIDLRHFWIAMDS